MFNDRGGGGGGGGYKQRIYGSKEFFNRIIQRVNFLAESDDVNPVEIAESFGDNKMLTEFGWDLVKINKAWKNRFASIHDSMNFVGWKGDTESFYVLVIILMSIFGAAAFADVLSLYITLQWAKFTALVACVLTFVIFWYGPICLVRLVMNNSRRKREINELVNVYAVKYRLLEEQKRIKSTSTEN